jgi:arylsulfatase A-like enzyme
VRGVRSHKNAIVVVVDRLGAGFLGPYGNTWLDTPQFNRLASQSLLCEMSLIDSPSVARTYRAWWRGCHALESIVHDSPSLPQLASRSGWCAGLISDDATIEATGFAERRWIETPAAVRAEELEQTGMGAVFLEAARRLKELSNPREPFLLWVHCRGMAGPWDAPLALRQQFADEDDPEPPDFLDPPERVLPSDFDPDEQLGLVQAYDGQVSLLDACLGILLDALDESPLANETLLTVTSPRGYPLGEHRHVGGEALYGELLHVPLLVRLPGERGAVRSRSIVQPSDLHATLVEWLGLTASHSPRLARSLLPLAAGEALAKREIAVATSGNERAIRTPAWLLRESLDAEGMQRRELYAKPDDRWEANEVASRGGEIVELLAAAGDQFEQFAAGNLAELSPLAEILTEVRR